MQYNKTGIFTAKHSAFCNREKTRSQIHLQKDSVSKGYNLFDFFTEKQLNLIDKKDIIPTQKQPS